MTPNDTTHKTRYECFPIFLRTTKFVTGTLLLGVFGLLGLSSLLSSTLHALADAALVTLHLTQEHEDVTLLLVLAQHTGGFRLQSIPAVGTGVGQEGVLWKRELCVNQSTLAMHTRVTLIWHGNVTIIGAKPNTYRLVLHGSLAILGRSNSLLLLTGLGREHNQLAQVGFQPLGVDGQALLAVVAAAVINRNTNSSGVLLVGQAGSLDLSNSET